MGMEVLRSVDVKAKIALFNSSFSSMISVEESTKEILEQQDDFDDMISWVSTSNKSVRFHVEDDVFYRTSYAESDDQLWYSLTELDAFESEVDDDAMSIKINLPKVVKKGKKLYQSCAKADGANSTFTKSHRQGLVKLYRDVDELVGLEKFLLSDEGQYERNRAILSLINEFACDGECPDEAVCALASQTITLPARRRARELAVAQATTVFEGKEQLSI